MFHGVQTKNLLNLSYKVCVCTVFCIVVWYVVIVTLISNGPSTESYLAIGHVKWIGMQKCAHHHKMEKELIWKIDISNAKHCTMFVYFGFGVNRRLTLKFNLIVPGRSAYDMNVVQKMSYTIQYSMQSMMMSMIMLSF